MPRSNPLVLVGPMGAGKTSVGRRVAKALGVDFVDTDAVIQREFGPIEQIFAREGEAVFRARERVAVRDALGHSGVVSLGGGAVLDPDTRAQLGSCEVVLLTVDPRVVAARLHGTSRPLLAGEQPLDRWRRLWAERRPLYESVADITVDTSHGPLQNTVERIVAWALRDDARPLDPQTPVEDTT